MKNIRGFFLLVLLTLVSTGLMGQVDSLEIYKQRLVQTQARLKALQYTELVQSMSQRSQLTPNYLANLKALIARQAYNFWVKSPEDKYVSHLTIYSALYYANKLLTSESKELDFYGMMRSPIAYNQAMGHDEHVTSIQFGADPDFFYSAGSDGKVIKWDLKDIKNVPEVIYEGDHLITSIDVSHDGNWMLIVTKKEGIVLLNLNITGDSPQIAIDPSPAQAAVFMPNELKYLVADQVGKIRIKDFENQVKEVGRSDSKVLSFAVKESDNKIFAGTEEGLVHIWKDTMHSVLYSQKIRAIHSLAISHDQQYLALGDEFGEAIIWDVNERKIVRRISGHSSAITKVEFSPDDRTLLSASRDGTIRVWDLENTKRLPLVLDDHNGWVLSATFDITGEMIISGSADKNIRVFPTTPQKLADRICDLVTRNLTPDEWLEYVGNDIPYQKTCPNLPVEKSK